MNEAEILTRLGLALAIGFLIGIERGWRTREEGEGERTAGIRTFALIGLSGGIWGLLSATLGAVPLAAAFIAFAGAMTLFRWRETEREGLFGATTLTAIFLTFALGAYAVLGDMTVAAAAAVVTTGLLASKEWLHEWLKAVSWEELRATLILLAMSFVVLPVLPDRGFGPYDALNPRTLWQMTIAIAGVSYIGYVAVRIAGARYGVFIAGVAGGLVSSTVATLDFARKARDAPARARLQLAGALAASATMFARVGVIVALFGPSLLARLAAPLAAAMVVIAAAALILEANWSEAESGQGGKASQPANPFELGRVFSFAAILAVILVATKVATANFGAQGGIALAAVAGIADVDAITLSMTQQAGGAGAGEAVIAILVAVAANSIAKSALALFVGGPRFGLTYAAVTLVALAAGGAMALAQMSA